MGGRGDVNAGLERDQAALLVAIGARRDGRQVVLTVEPGERESTDTWAALLRDRKARGRACPRVVVGDGHRGIWGGRLCQISDHETQRDDVRRDRLSRARRHLRDQPVPARKEQPALVGQRDVRAASTAHPKVLSQLVNRRAESRG